MRANIPRNQNQRGAFELEGVYLQAMQTVSTSLMEVMPDGEELWEILGKTEALLMEAQMTATPVEELFPHGGVAGFCQSILDEYKTKEGYSPKGGKTAAPASRRRNRFKDGKPKSPKGGEGARRYRRVTKLLTVCGVLLLAVFLVLQSGLHRFIMQGSAYYHEELYNFENTVMEPCSESLTFSLTPVEMTGLEQVLYTDAEGYTIRLSEIGYREREVQGMDENGRPVKKKLVNWYVTLHYTVDAGFFRIHTVTPEPRGTAVLTLSDGTVYESVLTSDSSGPLSKGVEFMQITVLEGIPRNVSLAGATLTVTMAPPTYRVWERVGMGTR